LRHLSSGQGGPQGGPKHHFWWSLGGYLCRKSALFKKKTILLKSSYSFSKTYFRAKAGSLKLWFWGVFLWSFFPSTCGLSFLNVLSCLMHHFDDFLRKSSFSLNKSVVWGHHVVVQGCPACPPETFRKCLSALFWHQSLFFFGVPHSPLKKSRFYRNLNIPYIILTILRVPAAQKRHIGELRFFGLSEISFRAFAAFPSLLFGSPLTRKKTPYCATYKKTYGKTMFWASLGVARDVFGDFLGGP